jgi:hypothetical protein
MLPLTRGLLHQIVSFKLSQSQENCMLISYGRISKPLSTNNNNIHELDRTVFEIYREI